MRASFSSKGPTVDGRIKPDIVAPGVNIYSGVQTNFTAGQQYDASGFGVSQGTSVSSPMVAGECWPAVKIPSTSLTLRPASRTAFLTASRCSVSSKRLNRISNDWTPQRVNTTRS